MAKPLDLRGQTFCRLFALRRVKTPKGDRWYCFCKCGGRALVDTSSLRSGKVKSCGCLRLEAVAFARAERERIAEQQGATSAKDASEAEDRLRFSEDFAEAVRGLGIPLENI